jgi:hypothetical protein
MAACIHRVEQGFSLSKKRNIKSDEQEIKMVPAFTGWSRASALRKKLVHFRLQPLR